MTAKKLPNKSKFCFQCYSLFLRSSVSSLLNKESRLNIVLSLLNKESRLNIVFVIDSDYYYTKHCDLQAMIVETCYDCC